MLFVYARKTYSKEACLNKAKDFDKDDRFKEYLNLYERVNLV